MAGDRLACGRVPDLVFGPLIPRPDGPEETATAARFLASDDCSYVSGLELVADGGTTVI